MKLKHVLVLVVFERTRTVSERSERAINTAPSVVMTEPSGSEAQS